METALIVSNSEKATAIFSEALYGAAITRISAVKSCAEARRLLLERSFDLIVVNAMLKDESGERFSRHVASTGISQVILAVKNEYFDEVSSVCENDGVLTVSKPLNKTLFRSALTFAKSTHSRVRRMQSENSELKRKIEDIRVVDRAKCMLISFRGMNEREAHRHIEKRAMDERMTRREIAEGILNEYDK